MTAPSHHALFTYGTLQREDVQQHLFGRTLQGQPDVLTGFTLGHIDLHDAATALTGQARFLMLHPDPLSAERIEGTVYALTAADLEQADHYEGPTYQRIAVPLESGQTAWVYIAAEAAAHE